MSPELIALLSLATIAADFGDANGETDGGGGDCGAAEAEVALTPRRLLAVAVAGRTLAAL